MLYTNTLINSIENLDSKCYFHVLAYILRCYYKVNPLVDKDNVINFI